MVLLRAQNLQLGAEVHQTSYLPHAVPGRIFPRRELCVKGVLATDLDAVYRTRFLGDIFSLCGPPVNVELAAHLVWAAEADLFDQPLLVVAFDEGSHGRSDFFDITEYPAIDGPERVNDNETLLFRV